MKYNVLYIFQPSQKEASPLRLVARERYAKGKERARGTPLRESSRGQLRSPEMESLLAGYANSFSLCTGYLCTARRCIACLLACTLIVS